MAKPIKQFNDSAASSEHPEESSEMFERFQQLKPLYASKGEAVQALARNLEQLAGQHKMNVENLLREAHTTARSEDHHHEALKLERQIALLRR